MAECDPQALFEAGRCFNCYTSHQRKVIELQLLCEIAAAIGGGSGAVYQEIFAGDGETPDVFPDRLDKPAIWQSRDTEVTWRWDVPDQIWI